MKRFLQLLAVCCLVTSQGPASAQVSVWVDNADAVSSARLDHIIALLGGTGGYPLVPAVGTLSSIGGTLGLIRAELLEFRHTNHMQLWQLTNITAAIVALQVSESNNVALQNYVIVTNFANLTNQLNGLLQGAAGNLQSIATNTVGQFAQTRLEFWQPVTNLLDFIGSNSTVLASNGFLNVTSLESIDQKFTQLLAGWGTNTPTFNITNTIVGGSNVIGELAQPITNSIQWSTLVASTNAALILTQLNALTNGQRAGNYELENVNSNLMSHLHAEQIKQTALLSNGFASNSFNVTVTNTVGPELTNLFGPINQYASDALAGKDPASAAASNAPTNYGSLLATATALSPFGSLGILAAPVLNFGTLPANFMQVSIPRPIGGGSWVFDFNPLTHFGGPISAFRVAAAWVLLLLFLVQCGRIAQEATQAMASAQQTHSPNVSVLGNNAGLVIGFGYVAVFIAAAGAFALVMASVIDKTLFGQLANNPLAGFGTDALLLANLLLPLGQIISQAVWLLTARWLVVAQSWIFATIIRLMAA